MALNPRSSRNGSANTSYEPGGIFQGKITLVYGDGTVRVFVRMLGINVGPCRIVGKQHDEEFVVNDEVLVAYLDNQKSEMVVIGRLTDRPGAEAATTEPIGHEDKTESTISFVNATRVFTIAPVGDSFNVWCVGKRYTKTAAESIALPATTGLYYIYYSSTGVLSYKTSFFTWDQDAPTAYIYYNSTTAEAEFFADERHGVTLDWATHEYLHRTRGASLAEGLGASGYTLAGTGSSNADMQISIENGTFFDEDLEVNITHSATPTANTWEQRLQSPGYIPIFYRFGSGGAWRLDTATAYPVKYGSARATYNLSSSGTWSTPDMTSGKFGVTWIVATNNLNEPVIGILGQTVSDNIGQAEDVSYADLDLTGLPIVEIRPLYKLIYETNTGYTNAVKSRLAGIADIRANQAINIGIGASALSSLTDVGLTTTVANDILAYNGSNWTNTNTPTFQSATIIGGVTVDTSTFSVDAINNRVGIGTVSPSTALQVVGTVTATAFAGALTGNVIGNVTGNVSGTAATVTGAAQTSITSLGTLTGLTVTNAINGTLIKTVTGTSTADLIYGNMADNDQFRIRIGGTATNAGFVEIATADDGTEPIHVRQYTGVFTTLTRTATLLDGSGNTSFPGTVTAPTFSGGLASSNLTGQTGMWTSAGRPGATRLYRNDYDDGYNIQTYWTGSRWRLYGYLNNTAHADTHVGYADSAGSASTAASSSVTTFTSSIINGTTSANSSDHASMALRGGSGGTIAGMSLWASSVAPQFRVAANANDVYLRNANDSIYCTFYAILSNQSSVHDKQDIEAFPQIVKSASAAVNEDELLTGLNVVRQLRPVNYRWKEELHFSQLPSNPRRAMALSRLNGIRNSAGLEPFQSDELRHDCARDNCDGTAENPCPWTKNWENGNIGFIAQEVGAVVPQAANIDRKGEYSSIDNVALTAITVAAIKELDAKVTSLMERIEALENK